MEGNGLTATQVFHRQLSCVLRAFIHTVQNCIFWSERHLGQWGTQAVWHRHRHWPLIGLHIIIAIQITVIYNTYLEVKILGWREINQQDATNSMFIIKRSISTCFGHHYARHQENKTVYYCVWFSALVVLSVVVLSWVVSCELTTQLHKTTANHSLHTQAEHRMQ